MPFAHTQARNQYRQRLKIMSLSCFYLALIKIWAPRASWEINEHSYCYWNQHKGILCSYLTSNRTTIIHYFISSQDQTCSLDLLPLRHKQCYQTRNDQTLSSSMQPSGPSRAGRCDVYASQRIWLCSVNKICTCFISSYIKLVSIAGCWWMINSSSMTGLLTPSHICSSSGPLTLTKGLNWRIQASLQSSL